MSGPVDRAVKVLAGAGFSALSQPIAVGGIRFCFSAILSSEWSLDLVVLIDTFESGAEEKVRREVVALARALDLAQSRRPLTIVLIGQRWSEVTERAISRIARVLRCEVVLDEEANEVSIRGALAVLLPLDLTPAPDAPEESWSTARTELLRSLNDPGLEDVIIAAPRGAVQVEKVLLKFLAVPLEENAHD